MPVEWPPEWRPTDGGQGGDEAAKCVLLPRAGSVLGDCGLSPGELRLCSRNC
jgi:hypothetical protein